MSRDIWIVSDTHFSHSSILNFTDSNTGLKVRPEFDNVEQMDECMIENWNSVVKAGDIVYHLGDVTFGDKEKFKSMWPKLQGSKRLIVGNHDDIKFLSSGGFFKKVGMWRMFPEFGLLMSHVPLHLSSMYRHSLGRPLFGIHGHIHQHSSPIGPYRNVCVEKTNYCPVNIETLAEEAKQYFDNQWEIDRPFLQP